MRVQGAAGRLKASWHAPSGRRTASPQRVREGRTTQHDERPPEQLGDLWLFGAERVVVSELYVVRSRLHCTSALHWDTDYTAHLYHPEAAPTEDQKIRAVRVTFHYWGRGRGASRAPASSRRCTRQTRDDQRRHDGPQSLTLELPNSRHSVLRCRPKPWLWPVHRRVPPSEKDARHGFESAPQPANNM